MAEDLLQLHKYHNTLLLQEIILSNFKGIEVDFWIIEAVNQNAKGLFECTILTPDLCTKQKLNDQITLRLYIKNDFFVEGRVH